MRKLLSLVLVLTLVLGSMSFAFAAPAFSDVDDEDVLAAVKRLNAFGIVDGYDDGSYKPEKSITRAEFAKLLVVALGLDNAAQAASTTRFTDANGAWYTGYVEVAAGQGLVNGYPDGTFKPNQTVSYAEAVTMLVRALGYKDSFLPGSWPGNYVAKAAELDITDNVSFTPSGLADRGSVAVLLDNTLDAKVITQSTYGDENTYTESNETLLEEKLGFTIYEDAEIVAVPRVSNAVDKDEIRIKYVVDGTDKYKNLEFASDLNVDQLFGLKADVYADGSELVYADVNGDFDFFYDQIDLDGTDTIDSDNEADFILMDKSYEFESGATIYVNNKALTDQDSDNDVDLDDFESVLTGSHVFGKYVVNEKGRISFADVFKFDGKYDGLLVTKVDGEKIEYLKDSDKTRELDLKDDADAYVIYNNKGELVDIEDVEADNVLYIADTENKATGDKDYFVIFVAQADVVEGQLEEYEGTSTVVIDEDSYDTTAGNILTSSIDDNDNVAALSTNDLEDLLDENVKAYLDLVGDVRHLVGSAEATSDDMYGVFLGYVSIFGDESIKVFTTEGEKVVYYLDLDTGYSTTVGGIDLTDPAEAKTIVIKYTLDKDGEINTIDLVADLNATLTNSNIGDSDNEYGSDSIEIAGTEYYVQNDTILMDVEDYISTWDTDDIKFFSFDDLSGEKVAAGTELAFDANSKNEFKAVVFKSGAATTTDDTYYGYILDVKKTSDGYKAKVDVYGEGVQYYYAEDVGTNEADVDNAEEAPVKFTLNSKDELKLASPTTVFGVVYETDGDFIRIETFTDADADGDLDASEEASLSLDTTWYKVTDDTVYYDGTDVKDYYDLDEDDTNVAGDHGTVVKVLLDGRTIKAVKLY